METTPNFPDKRRSSIFKYIVLATIVCLLAFLSCLVGRNELKKDMDTTVLLVWYLTRISSTVASCFVLYAIYKINKILIFDKLKKRHRKD